MSEISEINLPSGSYDIKDGKARSIVAPEFSSSTSYAVGDYVIYEGALYKCTTAHSAGAWSSEDFTQTQVVDEVGGGGSGHTIENASGTALTQRDTLQFKGGLSASDDSTNEVTVVDDTVPEIEWSVWNAMTPQEQEAIPNAILLNAPGGGGGGSDNNFVGTNAQWEALSTAEQNAYDTMDITDDAEGGNEFVVERHHPSTSLTMAAQDGEWSTIDVSKNGYTPIGLVGAGSTNGNSALWLFGLNFTNGDTDTAYIALRNLTNSTLTLPGSAIYADVLYCKN